MARKCEIEHWFPCCVVFTKALKSVQLVGWFSQDHRTANYMTEASLLSFPFPSCPARSLFLSHQPPHITKRPLRRTEAWQGECCNTVSAKRTEIQRYADAKKKNDPSEMPGLLSGGLTVLICGEASMLSASITGQMFHLCTFADFTWRNGLETL